MIAAAIGLTFVSYSWVVWTVLMVVMLFTFGRHHPRTFDEEMPLDRTRKILAVVALIMFVLCFTPSPIEPLSAASLTWPGGTIGMAEGILLPAHCAAISSESAFSFKRARPMSSDVSPAILTSCNPAMSQDAHRVDVHRHASLQFGGGGDRRKERFAHPLAVAALHQQL